MSRRPRNPYLHPPDLRVLAFCHRIRSPEFRKHYLIPLRELRRAIHEYEHPHLHIDIDALIRRLIGSILLPIDSEFTPFILTVHRGVDHERCI
ncbi:MAG: hypothetical protein Q4F93_09700 [bacterium]|nr:hypothetical protein [bacterium]